MPAFGGPEKRASPELKTDWLFCAPVAGDVGLSAVPTVAGWLSRLFSGKAPLPELTSTGLGPFCAPIVLSITAATGNPPAITGKF